MQVTAFGLLLVPLCLLFMGQPVRLLQLALITQIFEAAAAVVVAGTFGLQPSLVPGLMFLAYVTLQYALGMRYPGEAIVFRALAPLLVFAAWCIVSGIVLTDVFAGVPVSPYRSDLGYVMVPLRYSSGNITQGLYLVLNTLVAVGAALFLAQKEIPYKSLISAYLCSGYIVVFIGLWQLASRLSGIWWPAEILHSNSGWAILEQNIGPIPRIQGPFSEPSSMGSYLAGVAFCSLWLSIRGYEVMRPRLLLALSTFGVLISTSTSGILSIFIGLPLMLIYAVAAGGGVGVRRILATVSAVTLGGVIVLGPVFLLKPELSDAVSAVVEATLEKKESTSYEERSQADRGAIETTVNTYGLGVGWGSFRSSSLIAGLLVNSGVIGLALILWFVIRLARFKTRAQARVPFYHPARIAMDGFAAALAGGLIPALMAGPTINSLAFFIQIACLVGAASRAIVELRAVQRRGGTNPVLWVVQDHARDDQMPPGARRQSRREMKMG